MFKLLPWTEGKYHILMDGEVIGHTEFDESLLVNLNGLMEADEIREMLDAVEEQYSTMMMVKLAGFPKTSKNAQKKLNKKAALKVKKETAGLPLLIFLGAWKRTRSYAQADWCSED